MFNNSMFKLFWTIFSLGAPGNISSPFELKPVLWLRKIEGNPVLWTCEILGAQHKISIKKLSIIFLLKKIS